MKKKHILTLIVGIIVAGCLLLESNKLRHSEAHEAIQAKHTTQVSHTGINNLIPATVNDGAVVEHTAYTLEYSETHEQARWVFYLLTRQYVQGTEPRTNDFRPDECVSTESAQLDDYRRSGYTRGHLCPAGDMKWDATAMSETFLLSNMSPQLQDFNDGIWNRIEGKVRHWANVYDSIIVVTGPVLRGGLPTIGSNKVSVPEQFYKIAYDPHRQSAVCFLVPHTKVSGKLQNYTVSIDSLESVTGIDFFPALPDDIEDPLEAENHALQWKW